MAPNIDASDTCKDPTCSCHGPNAASGNRADSDSAQDTVHWLVDGEIHTGSLAIERRRPIGRPFAEFNARRIAELHEQQGIRPEDIADPRPDGTNVNATVPGARGH